MELLMIAVCVIAVVDWVAVCLHILKLEGVTKPLVPMLLAVLVGMRVGIDGIGKYFVVGLLASTLGDTALFFCHVTKKYYDLCTITGMAFFALGHILSFRGMGLLLDNDFPLYTNIAAVAVCSFVYICCCVVVLSLMKQKHRKKFFVPVVLYATIGIYPIFLSLNTLKIKGWERRHGIFLSVGYLLFYISDTMVGLNSFATNFPGMRLIIMVLYHVALILIAEASSSHLQSVNKP